VGLVPCNDHGTPGNIHFAGIAVPRLLAALMSYPDVRHLPAPAAVALGRKGGLKGGKARAANMTKEERSEAAKKAANARWNKKKNI